MRTDLVVIECDGEDCFEIKKFMSASGAKVHIDIDDWTEDDSDEYAPVRHYCPACTKERKQRDRSDELEALEEQLAREEKKERERERR